MVREYVSGLLRDVLAELRLLVIWSAVALAAYALIRAYAFAEEVPWT